RTTGMGFALLSSPFLVMALGPFEGDRKSTRLNSSHVSTSYAVFCLKKKNGALLAGGDPVGERAQQPLHAGAGQGLARGGRAQARDGGAGGRRTSRAPPHEAAAAAHT